MVNVTVLMIIIKQKQAVNGFYFMLEFYWKT